MLNKRNIALLVKTRVCAERRQCFHRSARMELPVGKEEAGKNVSANVPSRGCTYTNFFTVPHSLPNKKKNANPLLDSKQFFDLSITAAHDTVEKMIASSLWFVSFLAMQFCITARPPSPLLPFSSPADNV